MHPTYILQQGRIKLHANQQKILLEKGLNVESLKRKDLMSYLYLMKELNVVYSVSLYLGEGLNVVSLLEKGLNVVSVFEERAQCCIFSSVYM